MDKHCIIETAKKALAKEFELDEEKLTPEAHLRDDLGLDSLDYVDMVIVLEQAFHFTIPDKRQLISIRTMGDIYQFIEKMQAEQTNAEGE